MAFLWWSGVFTDHPSVATGIRRARALTIQELGLLLWVLLVVGAILQPLQFGLVQMLEGYWPPQWRWLAGVRQWRVDAYRKRRERLKDESMYSRDDPQKEQRAWQAAWQLRHRYPLPESMMPTALGNVLRAAEDRAGQRYGLETVALWPRLHPVIGARLAVTIEDQRNQLDLAVRFCMVFAAIGITYLMVALLHAAGTIDVLKGPTYLRHLSEASWLYAAAMTSLILSLFSYRGAVAAAESYGISMEVAFDMHRFDLLAALHLPLPISRVDESVANAELSRFLRLGKMFRYARSREPREEPNFLYRHPPNTAPPKRDEKPSS